MDSEQGYDDELYILAFDQRTSLVYRYFGFEEPLARDEHARVADAKHLIFEGLAAAAERGADRSTTGALVDEQFGSGILPEIKTQGFRLAVALEKSGQDVFTFEYGDDFGEHIERFDPDFSKALVRYNADGDSEANLVQARRLKRLSDWLHERDRKLMLELLVPPVGSQLESVGRSSDRFDTELRPILMRRAIADLQDAGIEPDVWKIEGLDDRSDAELIVEQCRSGGRERVGCVLLGRGAPDAKVDHWVRQAAPVEGFIGFAIGRSTWSGALVGYLEGSLDRDAAAEQIANRYLRFVSVYRTAREASRTA